MANGSVEICANCGHAFGKLEKPMIWDEHVVCAQCREVLSQSAKLGETPASQPASQNSQRQVAANTVKTNCPKCGKGYLIPATRLGRQAKCKVCNTDFVAKLGVPSPEAAPTNAQGGSNVPSPENWIDSASKHNILSSLAILLACIVVGVLIHAGPLGIAIITFLMVLGTALWAAIDSSKIQLGRYKSLFTGCRPAVLFIGIVCMGWIFVFPLYLSTRHKIRTGVAALAAPETTGAVSPKRILPAFLFCLFLGVLGIHRFYAGRTGSGIAMLLISITVVGLIATTIWAVVDLVSIIGGGFSDRDGNKITEWT